MAYIQVGGFADGAADAAPSPARCARGRRAKRTPQRANKPKTRNGAPKKNLVAMLRGHKARRTFWEEETERSNRGGLRKQTARKAQFTATRARRSGAFALIRLRIAPRFPPHCFRFLCPLFSRHDFRFLLLFALPAYPSEQPFIVHGTMQYPHDAYRFALPIDRVEDQIIFKRQYPHS